jgi:hypothetical protein
VPQPAVHGEIDRPRSRARTIAIVCGGIGLGLMLVLAISGESDVAPRPVGAPVDAGVDANENNGIRQPD